MSKADFLRTVVEAMKQKLSSIENAGYLGRSHSAVADAWVDWNVTRNMLLDAREWLKREESGQVDDGD